MSREAVFISIPRAAQLLGCSANHLYRLIRRQQVPYYKLSPRATRVDLAELRDYMRLLAEGKPHSESEDAQHPGVVSPVNTLMRGGPIITKLVYKDRRRMFRFVHKRSEPTLLSGVLRLALVLWQLLSWLKLLR